MYSPLVAAEMHGKKSGFFSRLSMAGSGGGHDDEQGEDSEDEADVRTEFLYLMNCIIIYVL